MRTDEELMSAYAQGDLPAFEELYARHRGRVYGYLRKRSPSGETADELFQAAFMKLHEARFQYSPAKPFLPWLFSIAHTTWIDRLRKDASETRKIDAFEREPAAPASEAEVDLEALLAELAPEQRQLLDERYARDRSFAEIGRDRGMKESAVRQALSRITRKLRGAAGGEKR